MERPSYIKDKQVQEAEVAQDDTEATLGQALAAARAKKVELEEALTATNKEIDELDGKLAELMQTRGIDSFKVQGVGTFTTYVRNYPSVNGASGEEFFAWLEANGMGALVKRTVHPQTLLGWVNRWLEDGNQLPSMVNNFSKTRVRFTKAR